MTSWSINFFARTKRQQMVDTNETTPQRCGRTHYVEEQAKQKTVEFDKNHLCYSGGGSAFHSLFPFPFRHNDSRLKSTPEDHLCVRCSRSVGWTEISKYLQRFYLIGWLMSRAFLKQPMIRVPWLVKTGTCSEKEQKRKMPVTTYFQLPELFVCVYFVFEKKWWTEQTLKHVNHQQHWTNKMMETTDVSVGSFMLNMFWPPLSFHLWHLFFGRRCCLHINQDEPPTDTPLTFTPPAVSNVSFHKIMSKLAI